MTVPVQRGGSQDDPTVTNLILGAIDDLKHGFVRLEERITQRVEGLDERYVPRAEYEARHSDVRNLITRTEAAIAAEAKERESLEEKLTASRRFAFTASIAGLMAMVGLLSLILANLPR